MLGVHAQALLGGRGADEFDDNLVAGERTPTPVHSDVREETMFDLVPLARARWQVTDRDGQTDFASELAQFIFPQAHPITVAAASVSADQQPICLRVGEDSVALPPATLALDCEGGGLMVLADVNPADIALDVVDAVGDGLAQLREKEVMDPDLDRTPLGFPFPAHVLELADQLFLLGVHRDHRLAGIAELARLLV